MEKLLVYMAEDNELDSVSVQRSFKQAGKLDSLRVFSNGEQLLKAIESGTLPTFILLDMDLPVVDGFEVLKFLNENIKQSICTFVMSSGEEHEVILKKRGCKPTGFLQKPISYQDINEAFESYKKIKG